MNALVVGGAGFIGSHLCESLLQQNDKVICIDNFSLGKKNNIKHLLYMQNFFLIEGDASNRKILDNVFESYKPEYVFHLAANSDIQASAMNPDIEYKNTYSTTYEILLAMKRYEVKSLFFASTSAIYGDKRDNELVEDTPDLSPISYYGAAKLGSEALINAFSYMNDIKSLVFRFPNVIGPRLTHGVIYDFLNKLKNNSTQLEILGDGKQIKPYIHVSDLIDAIIYMSKKNIENVETYNIGVEGATSVKKIADIICEEMNLHNVKYYFTGGEGGWKGDVPKFRYCLDKIHSKGWKAKYNSDEAVRKTVKEVIGKGDE